MKRKWSCYWEENLDGKKIAKKAILFASMKDFSSLTLSLLPSVDEEDRREAVKKRLEERFVETEKLSFLYIELLEEQGHSELVFCCYAEKQKEFSSSFLYVIPAVLFGKLLKQEKLCLLHRLSPRKWELYVYERQRLRKYERLTPEEFETQYAEQQIQAKEGEWLVLGEALPIYENMSSSYAWDSLRLTSIAEELDYFRGERKRKGRNKNLFQFAPYVLSSFLIASIALGFFFEYQIEEYKELCKSLEEERLSQMFAMQELEKEIHTFVLEAETWEEEEKDRDNLDQKIAVNLWKVYQSTQGVRLNSLEYFEDGQLRMDFFSYSLQEYFKVVSDLLAQDFVFENHDSIRKEKQKYQIILEFREGKDEKE